MVCAIISAQRLLDFLWASADQLDFAPQQEAQAVDCIDIERIAHSDDQAGIADSDWDDFEPPRIFRSNLADDFRWNGLRGKIYPLQVRLRGESARDVDFWNVIFFRLHWGALDE